MKVTLVNPNFEEKYMSSLLQYRGVDDLMSFLSPSSCMIQHPKFLENIEKGALLLKHTLELDEEILIVVDSDCDGFTSAAIMYQYIKDLRPEAKIDYILHSGKQHGLEDHIVKLMEQGEKYGLIILPDSSSNDYEYHDMLKEIKAPCLVLDHHEVDKPIFSDNAVVINNQLSSSYRNKELTGAGVTYQFCKYLDEFFHQNYAKKYADLAALGIIGDMGSVLEPENRALIFDGIIYPTNNYLLNTMYEKQAYSITGDSYPSADKMNKKLTPTSIAFYIVPLINAMIRVGTQEEKERLFLGFINGEKLIPSKKRGAKGALEKVAIETIRECTNAKNRQNKTKEEAIERMEYKICKYDLLSNKVLFIRLDEDDKFPSELNGLIAMGLSAKYKKPTIVARLNDEGFIRGSARGVNDSELDDFKTFLLESELFEYAQGHKQAFGMSISNKNLDDFHKYANRVLKDIDFNETCYNVNFKRHATALDLPTMIMEVGEWDKLWGQKNPQPLIYVEDININKNDINICGARNDTLRFEKNGVTYIKFFAKDMIKQLQEIDGDIKINIVGKMAVNEWNGMRTPQIILQDYEIKENSILDF